MCAEWAALLGNYFNSMMTAPSVKLVLGFVIAIIAKFLGLSHPAVQALMLLMVCDFVLGAAHALKKDNKLDGNKLMRGFVKFLLYATAINITWLADEGMGTEAMGFSLRNLLCGYLSANEAISALTHLSEFGFPFPPWLKARLQQYRDSIGRIAEPPNPQPQEGPHEE